MTTPRKRTTRTRTTATKPASSARKPRKPKETEAPEMEVEHFDEPADLYSVAEEAGYDPAYDRASGYLGAEDVDYIREREPAGGSPWPFLFFLVFITVAGLFVYERYFRGGSSVTPPAPTPVVIPAGDLAELVTPIKEALAQDPAKALIVSRAYTGFKDALEGPSGKRVADSRILELVQGSILEDLDTAKGTMVGRQIDEAIAGHLGIEWKDDSSGKGWEPKTFNDADRRKLIEVIGAIAKAAEESR